MKYQPWSKLMADLPERKAHYTDAQFRAFIELLAAAAASRTPGTFPSLAAVRRITGPSTEFLVEQDDLVVADDGSVAIHGWKKYQRPFDETHAARQAALQRRKNDAQHDASSDANTVSSVERQNGSSTSTSTSTSPRTKTENVPVAPALDLDAWTAMSLDAEEKTGYTSPLGAPTSKLGQMALAQARDFGMPKVREVWSRLVATNQTGVPLTIGQIVIGADNLLRPIPKVNGKEVAAKEQGDRDRAASERRRAETRKLIDEQRAREH